MASVAHIVRRRRARKSRRRAEKRERRIWLSIAIVLLAVLVIAPIVTVFGLALVLYGQATQHLPTPAETIYLDPIIGTTQLVDRSGGTLIYALQDPLGNERIWIDLEEMPSLVLDATLMMEDPDFLDATRFDISRAFTQMWQYILGGTIPRERSIAGRLIDKTLLPQARQPELDSALLDLTFRHEIKRQFSPIELLEWYLNTNFYGNDAYGISAAAEVYLGKSVQDLTVDEIALLVAIPPEPRFNPFDNLTAATGRRDNLLRDLLANGHISQVDFDTAIARATPLRRDLIQSPFFAPDFALYAREQAEGILDSLGLDGSTMVSRNGLRITTTLDMDLYLQADCALRAHLRRLQGVSANDVTQIDTPCTTLNYLVQPFNVDPSIPPTEGALVAINVDTGEILSMVGTATDVRYQPGPTLQTFAYFEGFLRRLFTPASMVLDIPQPFTGPADGLIYTPSNPDGVFRGPVNLRDAMVSGLLPPVVSVADSRGMSSVLVSAHLIGINSLDTRARTYDLSLLERGGTVSVLDMTYSYSVFASMGVMNGIDTDPIDTGFRTRDPVAVLRIEDADGNVLWEYDETIQQLSQSSVFEPSLGFLVNDILSDSATRRSVLGINDETLTLTRPSAVVNGLTSDFSENWTVGYTPQLVTAVHLGRFDGQAMSMDVHGLQGATIVWRALMNYAHDRDGLPIEDWTQPPDVESYVVCDRSGLIPSGTNPCPTRQVLVPPGSLILEDTFWQSVEINSQTGQLATANTEDALRTEAVYFIPPDSAMEWWVANNQPLPPTEFDTLSRPEVLQAVQILQPDDFAYVGGVLDVRGTIDDTDIEYYQLSFGEGVNPREWLDIGGQQTEFTPGTSLIAWDSAGLDGVYTLQLSVVFNDGSIDNATTLVTVDNIAPTVDLQAGTLGQVFRFPTESVIPLTANATDNLAIDRVDFYHNGLFLGTDEEWPYGFEFDITRTGIEVFTAVVFDEVGNSTQQDIEVEVVRDG